MRYRPQINSMVGMARRPESKPITIRRTPAPGSMFSTILVRAHTRQLFSFSMSADPFPASCWAVFGGHNAYVSGPSTSVAPVRCLKRYGTDQSYGCANKADEKQYQTRPTTEKPKRTGQHHHDDPCEKYAFGNWLVFQAAFAARYAAQRFFVASAIRFRPAALRTRFFRGVFLACSFLPDSL